MTPLYVGYFTPRYADEAAGLIATLKDFGLFHRIFPVPDRGSWLANVNHKPVFIREMMARYPGQTLVYLDADARVRQYPALFDQLDCDIGFHRRDGHELLSGTLYFGPTDAAKNLVDAWVCECRDFPEQWDQISIAACVDRSRELRTWDIGPSYVQIFDSMSAAGEPVIEHLQASRRLKS